MNKTKKIAIAAVSLVMAGSMAFGIVGCGGTKDTWDVKTDENGKLTYADGTALNLNIGNQNSTSKQGIAYNAEDLSGATYLPDGKQYTAGNLKPAWAAMQDQLKVTLNDVFQNQSSNTQITKPITDKNIADYDVITGSLQAIVENSGEFLNIADYLDYMPNYKAFLDANPVTRYSLTGNGNTGAMYAAPYFDGNDDIEKYTMVNYLWVYDILDNDLGSKYQTTFKAQVEAKNTAWPGTVGSGTSASAKAYMGTTGSYEVDTTDPSDDTKTVKVKVDYEAAKTAATDTNTALGAAISAAAGKAYTGTSGNIVDLQNFAINEKAGVVTGAQLANILREYIKVAYKIGNNAAYTKLSDVFCSASAAWDVDLLVAMSRCVVTCGADLTSSSDANQKIYAISGRQTTTQRRVDLMALAGELYGIRGLESRYEYAYFDKDGKIQDSRLDANTYELLSNVSDLTEEGLVYIGGLNKEGKATTINTDTTSGDQTFMLHDYVQTQTKPGIKKNNKAQYNFAPILTAVSKWDVDGDGTRTDIMRFTESWRSVKNTGFCIPKEAVKNNPDKLSAVLTFIDYMFSTDGQILLSYGPQSTNGNTNPNGWWYAVDASTVDEVKAEYTLANVADKVADAYGNVPAQYKVKEAYKDKCFVYNGKVWGGMPYNGRQVPVVTTLNDQFYKGEKITVATDKDIKQNDGNIKINQVGNYTNYARYFIGSTLPIGNKDQGYEYQASAQCGIDGAATVTTALLNKTVKHVKLVLEQGDTAWYLIVPTALPLSTGDQNTLKNNAQQTLISGTYFYNNSSVSQLTNIAIDMLYYGLGSSAKPCGKNDVLGGTYANTETGAKMVAWLTDNGMPQRLTIMRNGWALLNNYYKLGYTL